jgi:hypothetical protein
LADENKSWRGYAADVADLFAANPQAHAACAASPELYAAIFRAAVAADSMREVCITALVQKFENDQAAEAEADPEPEAAEENAHVSIN